MILEGKNLALLNAGAAFFIWSLLGPVLNLSKLSPFQNLFVLSIFPCLGLIGFDYFSNKLKNFKKLKINKFVLLFLLLSGLNGVFFFKGLTLMPIAQAFLLLSTAPLLTFLIEVVFLKEKILRALVFALLLGFVGVYLVLSRGIEAADSFKSSYLQGVVLMLAAAMVYASRTVILKKHSLSWPIPISIFLVLSSQAIFSAPFAFATSWIIGSFEVISLSLLLIFSSIVAFVLYIDAIKKIRASSLNLVGYIQPFLAAIWGYLFLNQGITLNVILGGLLIFAASYTLVKIEET